MKSDRISAGPASSSATLARPTKPIRENAEGIPLEAIAQRAFELYAASGYEHGRDVEHWLEAERQLRKEPKYR
jgi:hypothetical protein